MEFFSRLNLDQSATRDDVERSYKHLSRVYHPGKFLETDFYGNFYFATLLMDAMFCHTHCADKSRKGQSNNLKQKKGVSRHV